MTSGRGLMAATRGIPRHAWLANTGGSIGMAMPLAVGAPVAQPDQRVLCLSAPGIFSERGALRVAENRPNAPFCCLHQCNAATLLMHEA